MRAYQSPREHREEILKLFNSSHYRAFVLIGEVAILAKCSLNDAETYLNELVEDGLIRLMTPQEAKGFGVRHGYRSI